VAWVLAHTPLHVKTTILALLALGIATSLQAQAPVASATEYTPEQLDELVAPIALYPDALVALILPAATAPSDVVLAAQYLQTNGDPSQVDSQPWDDSVKALVNYPEVIEWMSDNLDWTTALGRAFLQQPTQVMQSIQQLRAYARANGTLVDTPQQTVTMDGSNILINPTTPDAICVPEYNPNVVFTSPGVVYTTPVIFFGPPRRVGPWLRFECDWDDFGVWRGTWHPGWKYDREWRQPRTATVTGGFWRPDDVHQRELLRTVNRPVVAPPHPHPMARVPAEEQSPRQNFRPAEIAPSSRPDPRGWREDGSGRLATPPSPSRPSGPQINFSSSVVAGRAVSSPSNARPAPIQVGSGQQPPAIKTAPVSARPISEPPPIKTPPPLPTPPRISTPPVSVPPSGQLFGGYTRGTEAQDYSKRGEASRAAANPPPASHPEPAPRSEPPSRPEPAARPESSPPPGNGGESQSAQWALK